MLEIFADLKKNSFWGQNEYERGFLSWLCNLGNFCCYLPSYPFSAKFVTIYIVGVFVQQLYPNPKNWPKNARWNPVYLNVCVLHQNFPKCSRGILYQLILAAIQVCEVYFKNLVARISRLNVISKFIMGESFLVWLC